MTLEIVIKESIKLIAWMLKKVLKIKFFKGQKKLPVKMFEHESTIAHPGMSSSMPGSSLLSSSFITISQTACDRVGQL
jgi:hypothetical protein